MNATPRPPAELLFVRTTPQFDADTVPAGLLTAHRLAPGRWGRLVVESGSVTLVFDDEAANSFVVHAGETSIIPPARPHHVQLGHGASFSVEIHREPDPVAPDT